MLHRTPRQTPFGRVDLGARETGADSGDLQAVRGEVR